MFPFVSTRIKTCLPYILLFLQAYVRDVLDNVTAMLDRLNESGDVLNHLDNIYLTRLSLEVAEAGEGN